MPDPGSPYRRALQTLEHLSAAPLEDSFEGPFPLARSIGLAPTSGYRAVAQGEAVGLISRDADGVYRRGLDACRIGLSALGFGDLAAASEPVLVRLRQTARMTAFLGVIQDTTLIVGPFSMGRGAGFLEPTQRATLAVAPLWSGNAPLVLSMDPKAETGRWLNALVSKLQTGPNGATGVVGVLLPSGRTALDQEVEGHVTTARDRFLQASAQS